MSNDWYYAPWQYELRETLSNILSDPEKVGLGRRAGIPTGPVVALTGVAVFLAYTPLLQPGPPAKTPLPGILPIYNVGGGMIV